MNVFRVATPADVEKIAALMASVDVGMTTAPRSREKVAQYIEKTVTFIGGDESANLILFVLEQDGNLAGISTIIPKLGAIRPFYSFRYDKKKKSSKILSSNYTQQMLRLVTQLDGYTELATLFVAPKSRGQGLGRLLSFGRLAFAHIHQEMLSRNLMADIRGWTNSRNESPFWEGLTAKFIDLDFAEADRLSPENGCFIGELLPDCPILLNLLPKEVANCVGRPNSGAVPALELLKSVGFRWTGLCDVFDGGPSIECVATKTIISKTANIASISDVGATSERRPALIFAGQGLDFRATIGNVDILNSRVPTTMASALKISRSDRIYISAAGANS